MKGEGEFIAKILALSSAFACGDVGAVACWNLHNGLRVQGGASRSMYARCCMHKTSLEGVPALAGSLYGFLSLAGPPSFCLLLLCSIPCGVTAARVSPCCLPPPPPAPFPDPSCLDEGSALSVCSSSDLRFLLKASDLAVVLLNSWQLL